MQLIKIFQMFYLEVWYWHVDCRAVAGPLSCTFPGLYGLPVKGQHETAYKNGVFSAGGQVIFHILIPLFNSICEH